jgi:hypothetical protein
VRIVSRSRLGAVLGALPGVPRVVAGGNFATPWQALGVLDAAVAEYRLCMLNAQPGVPDRDGVILESPFVGPGMRGSDRLRYFPCRLSLMPVMLATMMPPDVVLMQTPPPVDATVSLGTEVNVLPAAIEAVRARGGLVIAQVNRHVPFTYGDAVLSWATRYSTMELVEKTGSQGIELILWLTARAALGAGEAREVAATYHIPISNTAAGMMLLEPVP